MNTHAKSVFFGLLCFTFGFSIFYSITDSFSAQRDPASVGGKYFQISSLSSEEIRNQINQKIKVFPTLDGKKSVHLGGFSSALCKNYPEIEMEFLAEGTAVAGETPVMKITAPCENGQDPSEMASVIIPVNKLLTEKPRNAEYKFDGFKAKIEFKNASDEWPRQWVLKSVHFKMNNGTQKSANFTNNKDEKSNPVVLEF